MVFAAASEVPPPANGCTTTLRQGRGLVTTQATVEATPGPETVRTLETAQNGSHCVPERSRSGRPLRSRDRADRAQTASRQQNDGFWGSRAAKGGHRLRPENRLLPAKP